MTTRIRLLVAVPDAGASGDVVEMPRGEAVAWVDAGRAEFVDPVVAPEPVETAVVARPENTARRSRRPRGR